MYLFYLSGQQEEKITYVKLADIASLWTDVDEGVNDIVISECDIEKAKADFITFSKTLPPYSHKKTQRIFHTYVLDKIEFFDIESLTIVNKLLLFLERFGDLSSVPSHFKSDSEVNDIAQMHQFDDYKEYLEGKNNYELLKKIKLQDHTLNVIECAVKNYNAVKDKEENIFIQYKDVVISALAHDLGKARNQMMKELVLDDDSYSKKNHTSLSVDYFEKTAKGYSRKSTVIEAINAHHSNNIPSDPLSRILFIADKDARDLESKQIIENLKQSQQEDTKEEQEENKDEGSHSGATEVSIVDNTLKAENIQETENPEITEDHVLDALAKRLLLGSNTEFDDIPEQMEPIVDLSITGTPDMPELWENDIFPDIDIVSANQQFTQDLAETSNENNHEEVVMPKMTDRPPSEDELVKKTLAELKRKIFTFTNNISVGTKCNIELENIASFYHNDFCYFKWSVFRTATEKTLGEKLDGLSANEYIFLFQSKGIIEKASGNNTLSKIEVYNDGQLLGTTNMIIIPASYFNLPKTEKLLQLHFNTIAKYKCLKNISAKRI